MLEEERRNNCEIVNFLKLLQRNNQFLRLLNFKIFKINNIY